VATVLSDNLASPTERELVPINVRVFDHNTTPMLTNQTRAAIVQMLDALSVGTAQLLIIKQPDRDYSQCARMSSSRLSPLQHRIPSPRYWSKLSAAILDFALAHR
jgi:hypothetical protein